MSTHQLSGNVDALCFVFPSGSVTWVPADLDKARSGFNNWQEENLHTWTVGCTMGFVQVRTPKEILERLLA